MRFGVDSVSVNLALDRDLGISYGTFWMGSWTQRWGWGHAEQQLQALAARNVTPVVHWWYWGDDISPRCVEDGCRDPRQNVWKDRATWYRMSEELAQVIQRTVGTRETIVIIETEFNKGGIESYEPFDGYLADQIAIFRRYGNIKPVISFGNWGHAHWSRFDRAAAAADYVGTQLLRSSVRDAGTYAAAIETLAEGARHLQRTFGKPSLITDLGLSSYPAAAYESLQADLIDQLFARVHELRIAGVTGILYRMLVDDPTFDESNYHGLAERHWGLLRSDHTAKPAFDRLVAGIRHQGGRAPRNLNAQTNGRHARVTWDPPEDASDVRGYVMEVGSAPGRTDVATVAMSERSFAAPDVPPGTYFIRVRTLISTGVGPQSDEVAMVINATTPVCGSMATPSLAGSVAGSLVTLSWNRPTGTTAYVVHVGSAPGSSNLLVSPTGAETSVAGHVPTGVYFVRLQAIDQCGSSVRSNEVTVRVGM